MNKSLDKHYTEMGIEPIVYSDSNNLDPYQHTVIKYVTRWRAKGGLRDLKAAQLILQKYIDKEEKLVPKKEENKTGQKVMRQVLRNWSKEEELVPKNETEALQDVIRQIKRDKPGKYNRIVTTGRGGLWAAANLGYALGITQIETASLKSINQMTDENILFVDGIVDTGETIQSVIIDCACLYCRSTTKTFPTYTGQIIHHSDYINLPISQPFDTEEN